jgi:prophage antirepressor-like protein
MNEIRIFESPQFGEIRTAGTSEEPMFCLTDVCKALDLSAKEVNRRLSKGVVSKHPLETAGGTQQALFVNEDGLYDVILDSRKPEAKAFRKWITSEVLPSIRKTGGYIATAPDDTPEIIMAKAIKIADMKIKQQSMLIEMQKQQINEQIAELKIEKPLADYTRDVLQSDTTYTLTQVAKDLGFRSIYAFEKWAVENKILYYQSKQWIPTAKYSEKGYFTTRTAKYVKSDGTVGSSMSTVVTEKGRLFLHEYTKKPEGYIKSGYEEEYPLLAKVLSEN